MPASVAALRPNEFDEAAQLIDRCMRPGAALSMAEDFPLLVGARARARRLVLHEGGQIMSHAASRLGVVRTPAGGLFRCSNIGAVCSDPRARGKGFAARLIETHLDEARAAGVELAMLWSEVEGFYERFGFRHAGGEVRFAVNAADLARVPDTEGRSLRVEDIPALVRLRDQDPCAMARPHMEALTLFSLPRSKTLVADENGNPVAYVTFGKGLDFEGTICEWGGNLGIVAGLIKQLIREEELEAVLLLGPAWHREYVATFEQLGCPSEFAPLAMFCVLNGDGLVQAVDPGGSRDLPKDPEALLGRLLGYDERAAQRPELPFYVWGLDSM